jgi:hypothetical protein
MARLTEGEKRRRALGKPNWAIIDHFNQATEHRHHLANTWQQ